MKEYGELTYLKLFEEYHFKAKHGITIGKSSFQDDVKALNALASIGWRVISKEGSKYLLERDVTSR